MWFLMFLFLPIFYSITNITVKKGSLLGLLIQVIYLFFIIVFAVCGV